MLGKSVVIIDDVMTTGGSCAKAFNTIRAHGGIPIGCIVAFDRQELMPNGDLTATQQFEKDFEIPVLPIATSANLITYLKSKPTESGDDETAEILEKICAYQREYGYRNEILQHSS